MTDQFGGRYGDLTPEWEQAIAERLAQNVPDGGFDDSIPGTGEAGETWDDGTPIEGEVVDYPEYDEPSASGPLTDDEIRYASDQLRYAMDQEDQAAQQRQALIDELNHPGPSLEEQWQGYYDQQEEILEGRLGRGLSDLEAANLLELQERWPDRELVDLFDNEYPKVSRIDKQMIALKAAQGPQQAGVDHGDPSLWSDDPRERAEQRQQAALHRMGQ